MEKPGITIDIPGFGERHIRIAVSDYTGTHSFGGVIEPDVKRKLRELAALVDLHIVTADSFCTAERELAGIAIPYKLRSGRHDIEKVDYVSHFHLPHVAAFGNGNNDRLMLRAVKEDDPETDVILLYLESFGNPRKFSRIARRVAQKTPIVAVKSARTASGLRGAHAGSVGSVPDQATDALFRQAGVIRVQTLEELLDVADLLVNQPLPVGRRVAVVGNAGGCGVLAADACESYGLEVPELAPETQRRLLDVVSQGAAVGNPIDLVASATAEEY